MEEFLKWFKSDHLPEDLQEVSRQCEALASWMAEQLPEGEERKEGLRKLLEAKDCFVRSAVEAKDQED